MSAYGFNDDKSKAGFPYVKEAHITRNGNESDTAFLKRMFDKITEILLDGNVVLHVLTTTLQDAKELYKVFYPNSIRQLTEDTFEIYLSKNTINVLTTIAYENHEGIFYYGQTPEMSYIREEYNKSSGTISFTTRQTIDLHNDIYIRYTTYVSE